MERISNPAIEIENIVADSFLKNLTKIHLIINNYRQIITYFLQICIFA